MFNTLYLLKSDSSLLQQPLSDWMADIDVRVTFALDFGRQRGFIKAGDTVVVITGWRKGSGATNTMRLITG